ncbi:MAG: 50S ribosomal protein L23 [Fibrobacterales bacterium]
MKPLHRVIVEPYLTEKTNEFLLDEKAGIYKYAFKVGIDANKQEIKEAIEKRFDVKVDTVNVIINRGKKKRVRQQQGLTKKWKKAYVKLKPGMSISEFEAA